MCLLMVSYVYVLQLVKLITFTNSLRRPTLQTTLRLERAEEKRLAGRPEAFKILFVILQRLFLSLNTRKMAWNSKKKFDT